MTSIIIISGEEKGEYLLLGRRTNVIGRAENLSMQILDDLVSRKHLRIRYDENTNEHYAEDMDSKHGIFVNNRKISGRTALKESDQICIGETTLLFTKKDFDDRGIALEHYKKFGEQQHPTRAE